MDSPTLYKGIYIMLFAIFTIILIAIDQISKYYTITMLKPLGSVTVINNFFSLTYVENRGAAFGILQNFRWIFIAVTFVAIIALVVYKFRYKPKGYVINTSLCFILSGAVGNMIDRVFRGYVIDMLEVTFINYPVFNIADCLVVVGTILLGIYILFIYKEPKKEVIEDANI